MIPLWHYFTFYLYCLSAIAGIVVAFTAIFAIAFSMNSSVSVNEWVGIFFAGVLLFTFSPTAASMAANDIEKKKSSKNQ